MPDYCTAYTTNAYTDLKSIKPVYVGVPERGGYWVDPAQYQQPWPNTTLALRAEDAQRNSWWGN